MTEFSASEAAIAGFRLIQAHARLVAAWCLLNVGLAAAMVVVTVVLVVSVIMMLGGHGQLSGPLGAVIAPIGALVAESVLAAGLFRLMLRPEEGGFLHLKLGRDELRLLAVWLIASLVLVVILAVGVALSGALKDHGLGVAMLPVLAALILGVWLLLRFGLAGPASFAERRLAFREAWRLSRGRAWAFLGMAIVTGCLLTLVWLLGWVVLVLLTGAATGFHDLPSLFGEASWQAHPGRFLIQATAQALFAPIVLVLTQAPLAAAYKAIRHDDEPYTPGPLGLTPQGGAAQARLRRPAAARWRCFSRSSCR